ncbi:hypothetical protein RB195_021293 [Necator americanus]|uniref:Uncharacterized protein n=1 Tax=Necator americanus TaxID=51031 RepID=A0ABR1EAK9_NECAM
MLLEFLYEAPNNLSRMRAQAHEPRLRANGKSGILPSSNKKWFAYLGKMDPFVEQQGLATSRITQKISGYSVKEKKRDRKKKNKP